MMKFVAAAHSSVVGDWAEEFDVTSEVDAMSVDEGNLVSVGG